MQWQVIDDDDGLEVLTQAETKREVPFRLLSFPVRVDTFEANLHFPNHWQAYESWKESEILPPVRIMIPSPFLITIIMTHCSQI